MADHEAIFNSLWDTAWNNVNIDLKQMSRHAAAIVKRGEVVSVGVNRNKTHPLQKKYSKNPDSIKLHAEIDSIVRSLRSIEVDDFEKCDLYVCRVKWKGKKISKLWGSSNPCRGCMKAIEAFNIQRVFYTLDGPELNWEVLERF